MNICLASRENVSDSLYQIFIPHLPKIANYSTKYFILSKVCTDEGGIKWTYHGLFACTGDNPPADYLPYRRTNNSVTITYRMWEQKICYKSIPFSIYHLWFLVNLRNGRWRDCPAGTWRKNDVVLTSMRRDYVASTSIRRHFGTKCPTGWSVYASKHADLSVCCTFWRQSNLVATCCCLGADCISSGVSSAGISWLSIVQGPVVQSIVSLPSSLRGQLIKCLTTLLPNALIFLLKNMRELLIFFSTKNIDIFEILMLEI